MISVIVPAYNAEDTIGRCLDALQQQTTPRDFYEVLVVDDGSTDRTVSHAQGRAGVRIIAQAHAGPAAARNRGVEQARGEIVLFTDADCAPAGDWIEKLAAPLGGAGEAGSASESKASPVVGTKGVYRTQQTELVARFVQLEYEDKYDHMARQSTIDFIDTYSAGYRRDVFLAHGGFDTGFPDASVEDQEFSFRLAEERHRMVFVPEAVVTHWGHPRTVCSYWRRKLKIGYWKVRVHRAHPARLVNDSHTPQSLRVQVLLVGLAGLCLVGGLAWPPLAWGAAISALAFLLTALPFVRKAWRKDRHVAVVAPFLLVVRALALGLGFAAGVLSSGFLVLSWRN
jgi:glycosyltransferase involved in cell wall biosynthesis